MCVLPKEISGLWWILAFFFAKFAEWIWKKILFFFFIVLFRSFETLSKRWCVLDISGTKWCNFIEEKNLLSRIILILIRIIIWKFYIYTTKGYRCMNIICFIKLCSRTEHVFQSSWLFILWKHCDFQSTWTF